TEPINLSFYRNITISRFFRFGRVFGPQFIFEQVRYGHVVDVVAADIVATNGRVHDRIGAGTLEEVWHQVVGVIARGPADGRQFASVTGHFGEVWIVISTAQVTGLVVGGDHQQGFVPRRVGFDPIDHGFNSSVEVLGFFDVASGLVCVAGPVNRATFDHEVEAVFVLTQHVEGTFRHGVQRRDGLVEWHVARQRTFAVTTAVLLQGGGD